MPSATAAADPPPRPPPKKDAHLLALAGGAAGAAARTIVAPLDRVKLLAQVGKNAPASSPSPPLPPWRAVLALARAEGPASLWRGNAASCLRAVPYSATQLAVHDALKRAWVSGGSGDGAPPSSPPPSATTARLAAGAAAGCAATAVAHPLDLLRLRMALPGAGRPRLGATLRGIVRADGPRGLFQGLGAALTAAAPFSALHLASFDALSSAARARRRAGGGASPTASTPHPLTSVALGAAAGGFALTALYPLDTLRRRTQMPGRALGTGLADAARQVLAGGVGGLYRGWGAAVLKIAPQSGARFALYEAAKDWLGVARRATDT